MANQEPPASDDAVLADQLAGALVLILRRPTLTDDDRLNIFTILRDRICDECGRLETDGRQCSCWNDE